MTPGSIAVNSWTHLSEGQVRTLVSQLQLSNGSALFVTTQALLANNAKTTKGADDDDWHCTLLCLGTIGAVHANHAEVGRYFDTPLPLTLISLP